MAKKKNKLGDFTIWVDMDKPLHPLYKEMMKQAMKEKSGFTIVGYREGKAVNPKIRKLLRKTRRERPSKGVLG